MKSQIKTHTSEKFLSLPNKLLSSNSKSSSRSTNQQSSRSKSTEDYSEGCDEGSSGYKKGGYHPVQIGQTYHNRYVIVKKLGQGHFSTVQLAYDKLHQKSNTPIAVALKIQKSAPHYYEAGLDEIDLLRRCVECEKQNLLKNDSNVVRLFDFFFHYGPNGKHICMVFEVLGQNLLDLIQFYRSQKQFIPIPLVKRITRDILKALDFLHTEAKIIHTDVKPENILLSQSNNNFRLEQQIKTWFKNFNKTKNSTSIKSNIETEILNLKIKLENSFDKKHGKNQKLSKNQKRRIKTKLRKLNEQLKEFTSSSSKCNVIGKEFDKLSNTGVNLDLNEKEKEIILNGDRIQDLLEEESISSDKENQEQINQQSLDVFKKEKSEVQIEICDERNFLNWDRAKIVDLGNACYIDRHFTDDITTRQYRTPETILGHNYSCSADIWSLACVVFELLTGDFLFCPTANSDCQSRDEDHLALMIELLGPIPKRMALSGRHSSEFFTRKCQLKHIRKLESWCLSDVLLEKYCFSEKDSNEIAFFLLPMLNYLPERRVTASQALKHKQLENIFEPCLLSTEAQCKEKINTGLRISTSNFNTEENVNYINNENNKNNRILVLRSLPPSFDIIKRSNISSISNSSNYSFNDTENTDSSRLQRSFSDDFVSLQRYYSYQHKLSKSSDNHSNNVISHNKTPLSKEYISTSYSNSLKENFILSDLNSPFKNCLSNLNNLAIVDASDITDATNKKESNFNILKQSHQNFNNLSAYIAERDPSKYNRKSLTPVSAQRKF